MPANSSVITTKDGQKIDVQTLTALTRPPDTVEGDIKLTNIDASQLANQIIHIPSAQSAQATVQPNTITGTLTILYLLLCKLYNISVYF